MNTLNTAKVMAAMIEKGDLDGTNRIGATSRMVDQKDIIDEKEEFETSKKKHGKFLGLKRDDSSIIKLDEKSKNSSSFNPVSLPCSH